MQCSNSLKEDFQEGGGVKFWTESIQEDQLPNARKVTIFIGPTHHYLVRLTLVNQVFHTGTPSRQILAVQ